MDCHSPIGLFDSGVGGLSVLREIRRILPQEDLLYYADSRYCPYGSKEPSFIKDRSLKIARFLVERGAKMIVVASNTTSTAGLEELRKTFVVPVVGLEPAVKPAVEGTRNGRVGVLATGVTLSSSRFSSLVNRFGQGVEVITMPCPGLVELVEEGNLQSPEAKSLLSKYLTPLLEQGADTIVLGCTHYPFLRPLVEELGGPGIKVVDTGEAVARQVKRILEQNHLLSPRTEGGKEYFYTSADAAKVAQTIRVLLAPIAPQVERVDL